MSAPVPGSPGWLKGRMMANTMSEPVRRAGRAAALAGSRTLLRARPAEQRAATAARLESLRRAAECALLGVVWFACSLPVVTAGAAWAAVAEVCDAWLRGEEPPLVRSFARAVRRELAPGFALGLLAMLLVALPYLEVKVALAERLPGGSADSGALCLLAAAALTVFLLAFPVRAATRAPWPKAFRQSAGLCRNHPWAAVLAAAAVGAGVIMVLAFPPLIVLIAGPVGYALTVVHARAAAVRRGREERGGRGG
jgi:uncharacterized membrane protein YesL